MKKFFRRAFAFLAAATFFCFPAWAVTLTVENVELKTAAGVWQKVVTPDKQIDLDAVEPVVSFVNNGRVPPGNYVNFRVAYYESQNSLRKMVLTQREDALEPFVIKKTSFVRVEFQIPKGFVDQVTSATLIVDDFSREFLGIHLKIENL